MELDEKNTLNEAITQVSGEKNILSLPPECIVAILKFVNHKSADVTRESVQREIDNSANSSDEELFPPSEEDSYYEGGVPREYGSGISFRAVNKKFNEYCNDYFVRFLISDQDEYLAGERLPEFYRRYGATLRPENVAYTLSLHSEFCFNKNKLRLLASDFTELQTLKLESHLNSYPQSIAEKLTTVTSLTALHLSRELLKALPSLVSLHLGSKDYAVKTCDLYRLPEMTNLTNLKFIMHNDLNKIDLCDVEEGMLSLTNLTKLSLLPICYEFDVVRTNCKEFAKLSFVDKLCLRTNGIKDVQNISIITNLTSLHIDSRSEGWDNWNCDSIFTEAAKLPQLTKLVIHNFYYTEFCFSDLTNLKTLKILDEDHEFENDNVAGLTGLTTLEIVKLNNITKNALKNLTNLTSLEIRN